MFNAKISTEGATQQTQNICITFVQRRPNVFDVGPTLYECYTNVLCLLGNLQQKNWPPDKIIRRELCKRR